MGARGTLFGKAPYEGQTDALFLEAMRDNCAYQLEHNADYRKLLDGLKFSTSMLKTFEDLAKIPPLPTMFFKHHDLFSMPKWRMPIRATSSGTKGKMSQIGFEVSGLWQGLRMVLRVGRVHKLFSLRPTNYLLLGYKPHKGNRTAVTKTAYGATFFAPALRRTFALTYGKNGYEADLNRVLGALKRYAESPFPTRFMGFPSYTYFLLRMMEEQGVRLVLPKGSKILLGGGWKQFYAEQVDKTVLYRLAQERLGIEERDIVEFFGAVEHPILYCDCPHHHFHVPVYSRVLIRDVKTLEPLPLGEMGLVNLLTPMTLGTPILSVMTDDLGILHAGSTCGCGIETPYLELIGRVGLKDIKTCAAGAAELLTEKKE